LDNYHVGKITPSQVSDFLNIKINRIGDYEKQVYK
jgi:hypothetical protein